MSAASPPDNEAFLTTSSTTADRPAAPVLVGDTDVYVGVSSWSDRSLTQDSQWYPKKTMKAAERIDFYAARFPLVEIENSYRFPPTPDVCRQWVARTPPGFRFDLQVWSLLTQQPTFPPSLWEDLQENVRPDRRDNPRLYSSHLADDVLEECWKRFRHAVDPLVQADRLGTLILRYPKWFSPRDANKEELVRVAERLQGINAAIEFGCDDWVAPDVCETTFTFLEELGVGFVCVDAPEGSRRRLHGASATTSDVGVIRLTGRRQFEEGEWVADWRGYRYSDEEISELASRVRHLASGAKELHVLVSTSWREDAVLNAAAIREAISPLDLRSAD